MTFFLVALAALACAGNASACTGLEARLPTPMAVTCTQNTNLSYADTTGQHIYLSTQVCDALSRPPSLNGNGFISWASAAQVLYHEWWHVATGETDEQNTDVASLVIFRHMLRTYWGMTPKLAQAFYMQAVGTTHYHPAYKPTRADPLLRGSSALGEGRRP